MKNENGSGSVYKTKDKRRRPWIARVTSDYTIDGRQLRKVIGTFVTKREAQEALLIYIKNPKLFSKVLFRDIKELWWENYKKRVTHKVTLDTHIYRMRSFDSLLDMNIMSIKLFDLQILFDNMRTSWSFRNGCKSVLNMIFDYALKNDFVDSNKIKYIELGKREKVIERKIFMKDEIDILWDNVDSKYAYIILILLYTGMRIGELLNLKNEDINLENKCLKVNISKTSAGVRIIPISSRIHDLFNDNMVNNQQYFLTGETTIQLSYSTFKPRFEKLLKSLSIQEHTIHDTRHTFATLLNNANANQSSISKLCGHSNFSITENVYTHKDTEELRKAVELIC